MDKKQFIDALLARAQQEGFEACEIFYASDSSFETSVFKGEILNYSVSDSLGLGFRALIGGKMGYASTQVLDEDAIDLLIEAARTNAALIESEDQQFIFEGSEKYAEVDTFNPTLEEISAAEKIDMAKNLEKLVLAADSRVEQVEGCEILSTYEERTIVNSKGLNVSHRANLIGGYVAPVAKEGEKVNTSFEMFFTGDPKKIDLEATAKKAVDETVAGLQASSVDSGEYRVCLRNDAASSLLATFSGIFSAENAQKGLSLLKGREGEVIAADCVTLVDDPHMAGQATSTPFDGEGVATYKKNVIDAGTLTTLLHNLKTANKDGVRTTANASRPSYASSVGIAPTNFYFQPGGHAGRHARVYGKRPADHRPDGPARRREPHQRRLLPGREGLPRRGREDRPRRRSDHHRGQLLRGPEDRRKGRRRPPHGHARLQLLRQPVHRGEEAVGGGEVITTDGSA